MDNSFRSQTSDTRPPGNWFASLQFFSRILEWLAAFVRLSEEEQREAGINLDDQHYE